ncbi:hypothetical protein [Clostridium algidicarnis]|uniref:Uncharacterized protein n=2 Tax=Clostridium algidicarnis TaxID=37659 RepID=A0A2S6G0R7_9CLOT|nr:hypothetical protein [Clostridium algidicarnis]MBB6696422.1 hypothetical protein [Clostridium algidicarnis]MBU3205749.1 hypothetical protein [Clostridium algidicarnis]MBU3218541.1 hypothetical protein [Clostridium algidicarnis]PPK49488.1 hypothetical protein BD821_101149 [Clostridium algidicarnis DSM 15099]
MEFRLNKVDNDLRDRINAETREGKVHSKRTLLINKEENDSGRRNGRWKNKKDSKEKFNLSKYAKGHKDISIEATRPENVEVEATIEHKNTTKETYKGRFLDIRK